MQSAFSLYTCEFDLSNPLRVHSCPEPEDLHNKCQGMQAIQCSMSGRLLKCLHGIKIKFCIFLFQGPNLEIH